MARILITGASGLLGSNLVLAALDAGHSVSGVSHAYCLRPTRIEAFRADLSVEGEAERIVDRASPDWIVHCAALTDVDACEARPDEAVRVNRDAAERVARAAAAAGARLVHISTDAVFDGRTGGYAEADLTAPVNIYGKSKLDGERAVLKACAGATIVRTNLFGWNAEPKRSLAEWFLDHLQARRKCTGFTDVRTTTILVNDLAAAILAWLTTENQGIVHMAGRECLSKYQFGVRLAETFGLDGDLIQPGSVESAGLRAPRSHDLCLNCDRAQSILGEMLPTATAGLSRFSDLRRSGWPERLQGLLDPAKA